MVILVGDEATGGMPFDEFCIRNLAYQLKGHKVFKVHGVHDAKLSDKELKEMKITPLNKKIIEEEGLKILGADDPEGKQDAAMDRSTTGSDLKNICLEGGSVDLLVVNQSSMGEETAKFGCARLVLTGGFGRELLWHEGVLGRTMEYRAASSGGATYDDKNRLATAGKLTVPAEDTLLVYNKALGRVTSGLVIITKPDATVQLVPLLGLDLATTRVQ